MLWGGTEAWFCVVQCSACVEQTALFVWNSGIWDLADVQSTLTYWTTLHSKEIRIKKEKNRLHQFLHMYKCIGTNGVITVQSSSKTAVLLNFC